MPGYWNMAARLFEVRLFSRSLALQIAAIEQGYNKTHYDGSS